MKVFNITDASTAALRNQGLENLPFRVGEVVVMPGAFAVLRGTAKERSELHPLVKTGAAAIDELPAAYAAKRGLKLDGSPVPSPVPAPPPPVNVPSTQQTLSIEPVVEAEETPQRRGR